MATGEDHFTLGLNEEEVIELFIENLSNILGAILKKKIILRVHIWYEMIIDNSVLCALLAIVELLLIIKNWIIG